eukprot:scaffold2638_cov161-Prasinococcus_capsulatus_cf.AAC.1
MGSIGRRALVPRPRTAPGQRPWGAARRLPLAASGRSGQMRGAAWRWFLVVSVDALPGTGERGRGRLAHHRGIYPP